MRVLRVNMIPATLSSERHQDSEPSLAVNPADRSQIVASAFTPDPAGGPNAPIFVSRDGGLSWSLRSIVPGAADLPTADINLAFDGTGTDLYVVALRRDNQRLVILRTTDVAASVSPIPSWSQPTGLPAVIDQPFVTTATVSSGVDAGKDRVYVACNDLNSFPGATAKVLFSADGADRVPAFNFVTAETRPVAQQNGPSVRTAKHQDGTVYAAFFGWRTQTPTRVRGIRTVTTDVVVTRDDNWGRGSATVPAFTALRDLRDGQSGQRVAVNVPLLSKEVIGQERVGSQLSIAVDPRNSRTVYLAWCDKQPGIYTLHLRRSEDGGQSWDTSDIVSVPNATNPGLAINSLGEVGFLYQQLSGAAGEQRWETRVRLTLGRRIWDGLRFTNEREILLASTPAAIPRRAFDPYIGDYLGFVSVGRDFYGIFSACNIPDRANFPAYYEHTDEGSDGPHYVIYQRNADFTRRVLLDREGQSTVDPSIDPFFVAISFADEFRRIRIGSITVEHEGCGDAPTADTDVQFAVRVDVPQPWWRESELVSVTYSWQQTGGVQVSEMNTRSGYRVRMPPVSSDGTVPSVGISARVEVRVGDGLPQIFERRVSLRPVTPEQAQLSCFLYRLRDFAYQYLLTLLPPFRHVGPFPDPPLFVEQHVPGPVVGVLLNSYGFIRRLFPSSQRR